MQTALNEQRETAEAFVRKYFPKKYFYFPNPNPDGKSNIDAKNLKKTSWKMTFDSTVKFPK